MEQPKCNICGVAQNEWVNGKCYACGKGHYCDMDADMIVEQRVYDWCAKKQSAGRRDYLQGKRPPKGRDDDEQRQSCATVYAEVRVRLTSIQN